MSDRDQKDIDALVQQWDDSGNRCKDCFLRLKKYCEDLNGIDLYWHARPGITYSLRAKHTHQTSRDLFAMVDIIDDDPTLRWLSVCFYNDMIRDPDGAGDFVPEGLFGKDALCFDVEGWDEEQLAYVESRLNEACAAASREG